MQGTSSNTPDSSSGAGPPLGSSLPRADSVAPWLARYWHVRGVAGECWAVLRLARGSLFVGLAAALLVWLPAQSREALIVMAEDSARARWPWPLSWPLVDQAHTRLFSLPILIGVLAYICGALARGVLDLVAPPPQRLARWPRHVVRHLPGWCSAIPAVAAAAALSGAASTAVPAEHAVGVRQRLLFLAAVSLGFAVTWYLRWLDPPPAWRWWRRISPDSVAPRRREFTASTVNAIVLIAVWGLLLVLPLVAGAEFVERWGPLGFAVVMLMAWTLPASGLVQFSERVRLPVFGLLFACALAFSWLDVNDNHAIRRVPLPDGATKWSPPSLQDWLRGRPDVRADDAWPDPYPVYVVAAEGGGLRAAYWTAMVLSAIQDRCPAFAGHVYAISGVSGGAVGAAVFAALVRRDERARAARTSSESGNVPCSGADGRSPGPLQTLADRVLRRDLLSPALVAGLGPDLLQRFLPWPIASFDRARALERALEEAWRDEAGDDLMAAPLGALWPPLSDNMAAGAVPALFLNTTNVETGEPWTVDRIPPHHEREPELRLSTAAILSARFPGITPAALAPGIDQRFVDGGYFDNSGASTLLTRLQAERADFDRSLTSATQHEDESERADRLRLIPYEVIVVRIGTVGTPVPARSAGLGELLSPVRAVLNGRGARGMIALEQLSAYVNRTAVDGGGARMIPFLLCDARARVPLGWLLSERSRRAMQASIGDPRPCDESANATGDATRSNAGSLRELVSDFGFVLPGR